MHSCDTHKIFITEERNYSMTHQWTMKELLQPRHDDWHTCLLQHEHWHCTPYRFLGADGFLVYPGLPRLYRLQYESDKAWGGLGTRLRMMVLTTKAHLLDMEVCLSAEGILEQPYHKTNNNHYLKKLQANPKRGILPHNHYLNWPRLAQ